MALIIGTVITATSGGVTRTFLDGAMVSSSRVSSGELPHIFDGEASPAFGGGEAFGQDIFFFGDDAGYFVMEGVGVDASGFKNTSPIQIADTFGTAASAIKFSPNTVFTTTTGSLGTRTTHNMNGYVGGLFERVLSDRTHDTGTLGQRIFWSLGASNRDPLPGSVIVQTSATTNKVHVHFRGEQADGTPGTQLFLTNMGDEDPVFGSGTTTAGDSAFIDNLNFGAIDTNAALTVDMIDSSILTSVDTGMATVNAGGASDFGVTSPCTCTCAFLDWGVWSVNYVTSTNVQKRFHLAGWVTGELADLTGGLLASQPTGSATYLGHMYGTVLTNGAIYTASGVYQNVWNFDTDTGAVSLSNFDGLAMFTGTATALANACEFKALSLTNSTDNAQLRGSFVKSTTDNRAGHIGDFHILGTNYKAAGIVAAQKQ